MLPGDLAPGDARCLESHFSGARLHRIESGNDPLFHMAYGLLWDEFGLIGELEEESVLEERLAWTGETLEDGCAMRYRLMLVTMDGEPAAVRDHTAIEVAGHPGVVVHLSHNLVLPPWRRSGLAGWMRALPVQTARSLLDLQNRPTDEPITLVGEMEPPDPDVVATMVRLRAYSKAGFLKVHPHQYSYHQPDFRSPEAIDSSGGPHPVPLQLIVRRVGRESETSIGRKELADLVDALYRMYERGFRESDMLPLRNDLAAWPLEGPPVDLVAPTYPFL
ncbi:MAG: hypothetical protein Fur0032_08040 [Terrimicrobiaceae bacterium]